MPSTREALVIGINCYPGFTTLDDLTAAVKDADSIATLLEKYGYETFRVQRLPRELNQKGESLAEAEESAVKAAELKTAIENLFNPPPPNQPPEMGLFFFSGHGWRKIVKGKEEVFLATSDVYPKVKEYGVSLSWLGKQLQHSPVKKIIVWLDCCFSGELIKYRDQIAPDKDFCLITSSRSYEPGLEQRHEQGLFTKYLTAGINPEHCLRGIVDSHKLAKHIESEMAQTSQAPQIAVSEKTLLLTSKVRKKAFQDQCPYRSLDFFTESPEDAVVFHGRTKLVRALVERVIDKERLIGVLGHSGSGKSSLLRAGLLHQLKLGQMIPGSNNWLYLDPFTPTTEPLQKLEQAFGHKVEQRQDKDSATPIILIIDQFEECFTMCDEDTRIAFIEKIQTLLVELPRLQIILGMRSDFRKEWRDFPQFNQQISKFNVDKLNSDEIREAIEKPAEWVGLGIESGLREKLISDVEDYPESLPLLQFTLTELWKKSREQGEKFLRLETYKALGGIEGTLEQRADQVYASLSPTNQQVAKRIFLELTQMGSIAGTRRRVCLAELANSHHSYEELDQVAHILANQENRLITRTVEKEEDSIIKNTKNNNRGAVMLEVVHEALIRDWRQLGNWQKEYRDGMIAERKIEAAAHEWSNNKKNPDYLLQGARLSEGESYLETYGKLGMLDGVAEEFILASQNRRAEKEVEEDRRRQAELDNSEMRRKAEEKARKEAETRATEQKKANKKLRIWSLVAVTFGLTASLLGIGSYINSKEAQLEKRAANIKVKLSLDNKNEIERLLESIELVGDNQKFNQRLLRPSKPLLPEVQSVLYQTVEDNSREKSTFNGHEEAVNSVAFSPDGKYLVSGAGGYSSEDKDNTVKLWDVESKSLIHTFEGHEGSVNSVDFSSDGKYLVSASSDNTVKLWSVENKSLIHTFKGHEGSVQSVDFSSDGKYLVSGGGGFLDSGSTDYSLKLWDVESKSLIHSFIGHEQIVWSVKLSPDGKYLVSSGGEFNAPGGEDNTIKLWSVEKRSLIHTFDDHEGRVFSVGFSPDSKYIVSGSIDYTIKLWDVEKRSLIRSFEGHENAVTSVGFSPDGKYLVSGSSDDTVIKLWSVENKSLIHSFNARGGVKSVGFSPDGKYLASGGLDRTVRLWSVENKSLIHTFNGHQSSVQSVGFSPDSKYLVSGGGQYVGEDGDKMVKLWSVENKSLIHTFNGHEKEVNSVGFSPDGKYLVSGSSDNTVKLWRGIDWKDWIKLGCESIRLDSVLASVENEIAPNAADTCMEQGDWSTSAKAEFLVRQGLAMAAAEANYQEAKDKFKQAQKLKPDIDLDPNTEVVDNDPKTVAYQLAAPSKVEQGVNLARQGKIEEALSAFSEAQKWQPDIDLDPNTEVVDNDPETVAYQLAAWSKVLQGVNLAREGKIEEALSAFSEAQKLKPDIDLNPNTEEVDKDPKTVADQWLAESKVKQGVNLARGGKIEEALSAFSKAQKLDPTDKIPAEYWASLCSYGSFHGDAAKVMDACDKIVALDPIPGRYRSRRGIARALNGDQKGAIEDFQAYVDWTNNTTDFSEEQLKGFRLRVQKWIDALRANQNPFTEEEIEGLFELYQ